MRVAAQLSPAAVELTVLMPCLDEARTVAICVRKALEVCRTAGIEAEVLVADNGSQDGSPELARAAGARVIQVPVRGYGAALRAGIEAARGRLVVMGDADDSYEFSDVPAFVARLRAGDELVMGSRFRGKIHPGAMPFIHRFLGNPVLTWILNLFFGAGISDAHCGMRGFKREAIRRLSLHSSGMEFASEMVIRAAQEGVRIGESPGIGRLLEGFELDIALVAGALLLLAGLTIDGRILLGWLRTHGGTLGEGVTRLVILGGTLIALGVEVVFSSFFLSILKASRTKRWV